MYRNVKITRGNSGWGGPLVIAPTETCNKILCVTTGGVNPLAKKIGEIPLKDMLGDEAKNLKQEASKIADSVSKVTAQMDAYAKELKNKAAAK